MVSRKALNALLRRKKDCGVILEYVSDKGSILSEMVVWSIDKPGRTMIDTLNTIITLEEKNVKVVSVKEDRLQTLDDNTQKTNPLNPFMGS